jgi:hypothetical protein
VPQRGGVPLQRLICFASSDSAPPTPMERSALDGRAFYRCQRSRYWPADARLVDGKHSILECGRHACQTRQRKKLPFEAVQASASIYGYSLCAPVSSLFGPAPIDWGHRLPPFDVPASPL